MIADYIENALIIDDNRKEVSKLVKTLKKKGVAVTYVNPNRKLHNITFRNHKIVFMDLYLLPGINEIKNQVSFIRGILHKHFGNDFGAYGMVLWSAHPDGLSELQEGIQKDAINKLYSSPLFMISLDKANYLSGRNIIKRLYNGINNALKEEFTARFFMEWYNSVKIAQDKTINNIYSLLPNYSERSKKFMYVLSKMAVNYNGISEKDVEEYALNIDAFKSFDDILHGELVSCQKTSSNIFENCPEDIYKKEVFKKNTSYLSELELLCIYSHLNSANFIDDNNIDLKKVIPGNVYKVLDKKSDLYIKPDKVIYEQLESMSDGEMVIRVVLEITPPCDFANPNKRIRARLIGGLIIKNHDTTKKLITKIMNGSEYFYKQVYPIKIPNNSNIYHIVFDYRYLGAECDTELMLDKKYKLLFRLKPRLFADILQKFSSHAARLGLSVLH